MNPMAGPLETRIRTKLERGLGPQVLEVIDESHQHSRPGRESHFKVVVVSDAFEGKSLLVRHREVHELLADELADGVHALSIQALTTAQWTARGEVMQSSPPCRGGSKS